MQALPNASSPPACGWEHARASHPYPTNKVTVKSQAELEEFADHSKTSGAVNEQAFGMLFWATLMAMGVAYGFNVLWYGGGQGAAGRAHPPSAPRRPVASSPHWRRMARVT